MRRLIVLLILVAGCNTNAPPTPDPLVVNAGADQSGTPGDTFTLNAGASVTGGNAPAREWTITGGATIINPSSVNEC